MTPGARTGSSWTGPTRAGTLHESPPVEGIDVVTHCPTCHTRIPADAGSAPITCGACGHVFDPPSAPAPAPVLPKIPGYRPPERTAPRRPARTEPAEVAEAVEKKKPPARPAPAPTAGTRR